TTNSEGRDPEPRRPATPKLFNTLDRQSSYPGSLENRCRTRLRSVARPGRTSLARCLPGPLALSAAESIEPSGRRLEPASVRIRTSARDPPPPPGPPWLWQATHDRSLKTGPSPSPFNPSRPSVDQSVRNSRSPSLIRARVGESPDSAKAGA